MGVINFDVSRVKPLPHLPEEHRTRVHWFLCILVAIACGCEQPKPSPEAPSAKTSKATPRIPILNDSDGLPEPLPSESIALWLTDHSDWTLAKKHASTLGTTPASVGNETDAARLRVRLDPIRGLEGSNPAFWGMGTTRGHVVFWYPLQTARQRLIDGGRAGLFRGVSWYRDAIPGLESLTAQAPMLLYVAVSTLDKTVQAFNGLRLRSKNPLQGTAPDGTATTMLEPVTTDLMGSGIDPLIETLYGYERRGGSAWLLLAVPFQHRSTKPTPPH